MLVRIFVGASWSAGQVHGDHEFDLLPAIGHKIAFATDDGWEAAEVRDVVHRLTGDDAADVALLVSEPIVGGDPDDALPLAALDRLAGAPGDAASPPAARRGPWGAS